MDLNSIIATQETAILIFIVTMLYAAFSGSREKQLNDEFIIGVIMVFSGFTAVVMTMLRIWV